MQEDFYVKNKKVKLPDLVIPRVCVSYNMKSVMEYLENKSVAVINSNLSRFLAKDKFLSLQKLAVESIPVPKNCFTKMKTKYKFYRRNYLISSNYQKNRMSSMKMNY